MINNRLVAAWSRTLAGVFAVGALLALGGCGGGSGAPNNPYAPGPAVPTKLTVLPPSATAYPGNPATLTIAGGTPPYSAFSSNPAVMPVAANVTGSQVVLLANNVEADVTLAVTVKDSGTQSVPVTIVVRPAPLFSGLTVLASASDCGSSNLCSGATGTAAVTAKGVAGAPQPGRQIRFDVVYGPFALQTTNPAAPLAQTLTVVTDVNGVARVGIQSAVDSTTQPAQIRATDLGGGQQSPAISPSSTTRRRRRSPSSRPRRRSTSLLQGRVQRRIPGRLFHLWRKSALSDLVDLPVRDRNHQSGRQRERRAFFGAVTNGSCVDPLTFTIADAAGKQTTALLENFRTRPQPDDSGAGSLGHAEQRRLASSSCTSRSFRFIACRWNAALQRRLERATEQCPFHGLY